MYIQTIRSNSKLESREVVRTDDTDVCCITNYTVSMKLRSTRLKTITAKNMVMHMKMVL